MCPTSLSASVTRDDNLNNWCHLCSDCSPKPLANRVDKSTPARITRLWADGCMPREPRHAGYLVTLFAIARVCHLWPARTECPSWLAISCVALPSDRIFVNRTRASSSWKNGRRMPSFVPQITCVHQLKMYALADALPNKVCHARNTRMTGSYLICLRYIVDSGLGHP